MRIRFGPFTFDPQSRLLWRGDADIALPPRVLGVFEVLLERAGQVVARQDLFDRVWKDAFVTDTSLAEAVSFLRQALGDDPQSPRYIQTVHRRGYRFLPIPTVVDEGTDGGQASPPRGLGLGAGGGPDADHLRSASTSASIPVASARAAGTSATPAAVDWQLVPWSIAFLCLGLALAAVWHDAVRRPPDSLPVSRLELRAAPGTTFDRAPQPIALSPDGRSLAWSACEIATGRCAIYARPIGRLDAHPLAGTEGGHSPVFSPDGRWIAFFADGQLKKIASAGGTATAIAPAPDPGGAAWGTDGRIAYAASAAGGLSLVDDRGGAPRPLTQPAGDRGELRHRFPAWVEGAPGLLFTIATDPDPLAPGTLAALGVAGAAVRPLRAGVHRGAPAGRGYLLLAAGDDLQAATFDERGLVLTGATDAIPTPAGNGAAEFAVGTDALAIVRPAAATVRTWSDGTDAGALARFTSIVIAPDSRRAAGVDAGGDIWTIDLRSGTPTRLTFGGGSASPAWSADSSRVFFAAHAPDGAFHIVSHAAAASSGAATPLASAPPQAFPTSCASDGRVALTIYDGGRTAIAIVPAGGGKLRRLTDGPFDESAAVFSPDGRWLALESTASGRGEVIVRSPTDPRQAAISRDGGAHPVWSGDGRAVYFTSGRRLMKAAFTPGAAAPAQPEIVLDRAGERAIAVSGTDRLLIERRPDAESALIALQWLRELRERLPLPVNAPR